MNTLSDNVFVPDDCPYDNQFFLEAYGDGEEDQNELHDNHSRRRELMKLKERLILTTSQGTCEE